MIVNIDKQDNDRSLEVSQNKIKLMRGKQGERESERERELTTSMEFFYCTSIYNS